MVEVNGADKHGRYEQVWLNTLPVMSTVKVFAMQAGQTNRTHYTDPYNIHNNKKCLQSTRDSVPVVKSSFSEAAFISL